MVESTGTGPGAAMLDPVSGRGRIQRCAMTSKRTQAATRQRYSGLQATNRGESHSPSLAVDEAK